VFLTVRVTTHDPPFQHIILEQRLKCNEYYEDEFQHNSKVEVFTKKVLR
jgi:hypothetical protein